MGKRNVLTTIAGYGLMFVGVFTGNFALAKAGYYIAVAGYLGMAANLLTPKLKAPLRAGQTIEYWGTVEPRRIIYGTQKTAGMNTIPPWTSGANNAILHQVLTVAGHEVAEIGDVYFNKDVIASANIGPVTGTDSDGEITSGTYTGKASIRRYVGTANQTVDYLLNSVAEFEWDSTHRGRGVAYVAIQFGYDEETYSQGKPEVAFMVKGAKVYDPRLDTSPGANPTLAGYIAYSANPALCLAHYLTSDQLGLGESSARIDWELVAAAANICDESVALPESATQSRYTCNVVLNVAVSDEERRENIETLVGAMMGHVVYRGGKWRMYAGGPSGSAFTISESETIGNISLATDLPSSEKYNYVRGQYLDKDRDYQSSEFWPRSSSAYETADGDRKPREVTFGACDNEYEAQRNAIVVLKRSRLKRSCTLQLGMSCYKLRPWDVVTVNLPQLGLNSHLMRCVGWSFSQEGYIEAHFLEEDNSTWDDPETTDYTVPSIGGGPSPNPGFTPYAPTSLTVTGITDAIVFSWTGDSRNFQSIKYYLYEDDAANGFAGATMIRETFDTSTTVTKSDTVTRYYWVSAVDTQSGAESTETPDGDGVAGAAVAVSGGFRVTLSHSSILKTLYLSSSGTSVTVSSSVAGGTPTYAYSWARISGSTDITANSSTASATTFSVTGVSNLATKSATFTLTVTDSDSPPNEATASVYVSFYRNDYGGS